MSNEQQQDPSARSIQLARKIVDYLQGRCLDPEIALMQVLPIADVIDAARPAPRWTREDPKVDGVYWWRADANDPDPDIHSVVAGRFYEVGMSQCTVAKNFGGEWLGPIRSTDFDHLQEQVEPKTETTESESWANLTHLNQ